MGSKQAPSYNPSVIHILNGSEIEELAMEGNMSKVRCPNLVRFIWKRELMD